DARILRTTRMGTSARNPLIVPCVPIRGRRGVLMTARRRTRMPWYVVGTAYTASATDRGLQWRLRLWDVGNNAGTRRQGMARPTGFTVRVGTEHGSSEGTHAFP